MFDSTISDNELRDLLRQVVLSGEENDSLTEKMIDMERNTVFATTPLIAVSLIQETTFLSQLQGTTAVKAALKVGLNMKWLFGGLGTLCVATTGIVAYKASQEPQNDPKNTQQTALINNQEDTKDSSAFFIATPSDTFGLVPTPPARENVTEQGPEVLIVAPEPPEEGIPAPEPPKGKRHARRLSRTLKRLERLQGAPMADLIIVQPENPPSPPDPPSYEYYRLEELSQMDANDAEKWEDLAEKMAELAVLAELAELSELTELEAYEALSAPEFFYFYEGHDSLVPAVDFPAIKRLEVNIESGTIVLTKSPDALVHIKERSYQYAAEDKNGTLSIYIQPADGNEEATEKLSRKERKNCHHMMEELSPLEISIPDGVEVQLHSSNGEIHVSDLTTNKVDLTADMGNITATNITASLLATASSGNVVINQVTGTTMARSYFGDLEVHQAKGTTNVYSSSGNVVVSNINGDLSLQSDFGDATLNNINGRTIINCNSGTITADSITGSQLKINSNFGDATIKHITAPSEVMINSGNLSIDETTGDLTVRSQFGEVTIDDVKGNLFVYGNSGNIELTDLDGNLVVESVFGNVGLNDTKGNVSITANSGNVTGEDVFVSEKLSVEVDFGNSDIELDNEVNDLRFDVEATMGTARVSKGDLKLKKDEGHIVTEKGAITIKGIARSGSVSFE